MSVGAKVDKTSIDATGSNVLLDVELAFERVQSFKAWLDGITDPQLTSLGYSASEIADLRSSYNDFDQLRTIYIGTASLAVAKDFRVFAKRIWGFGLR